MKKVLQWFPHREAGNEQIQITIILLSMLINKPNQVRHKLQQTFFSYFFALQSCPLTQVLYKIVSQVHIPLRTAVDPYSVLPP